MHAYIQIKVHTANQQYKDIELCIVCAWLHQFAIQITIISCVAVQLNDCEWRWLYLVIALDLAPARCSYTFNEFIDLFSNRHFHSSHYYSFDFSIQFAKKKKWKSYRRALHVDWISSNERRFIFDCIWTFSRHPKCFESIWIIKIPVCDWDFNGANLLTQLPFL